MIKKKCLKCGIIFESKNNMRKYCSSKCTSRNYYDKNKKEIYKRTRDWDKRNPEKTKRRNKKAMLKYGKTDKYKKCVMKNYYKNKDKWLSRGNTYCILELKKEKYELNNFNKRCKCGSVINIEIHHEIYPTKVKDIIDAIKNKRIYYMCRDCHKRKGNH